MSAAASTGRRSNGHHLGPFLVGGLIVAMLLAGVVSFYASSKPDGLEKVAEDKGFLETARDHDLSEGPLADYGVKGVENPRASVGLAGVIGVTITFAIGTGVFLVLRRRRRSPDTT
jgi:hypothetical protein